MEALKATMTGNEDDLEYALSTKKSLRCTRRLVRVDGGRKGGFPGRCSKTLFENLPMTSFHTYGFESSCFNFDKSPEKIDPGGIALQRKVQRKVLAFNIHPLDCAKSTLNNLFRDEMKGEFPFRSATYASSLLDEAEAKQQTSVRRSKYRPLRRNA